MGDKQKDKATIQQEWALENKYLREDLRGLVAEGADLQRREPQQRDRGPGVGITFGIEIKDGKARIGFTQPEDQLGNISARVGQIENRIKANEGASALGVSREDFKVVREHYGKYSSVSTFSDALKTPDDHALAALKKVKEQGGNIGDCVSALKKGGTVDDYLHAKDAHAVPQYIKKLEQAEIKDAKAAKQQGIEDAKKGKAEPADGEQAKKNSKFKFKLFGEASPETEKKEPLSPDMQKALAQAKDTLSKSAGEVHAKYAYNNPIPDPSKGRGTPT